MRTCALILLLDKMQPAVLYYLCLQTRCVFFFIISARVFVFVAPSAFEAVYINKPFG
jgi:hypothetical protein